MSVLVRKDRGNKIFLRCVQCKKYMYEVNPEGEVISTNANVTDFGKHWCLCSCQKASSEKTDTSGTEMTKESFLEIKGMTNQEGELVYNAEPLICFEAAKILIEHKLNLVGGFTKHKRFASGTNLRWHHWGCYKPVNGNSELVLTVDNLLVKLGRSSRNNNIGIVTWNEHGIPTKTL